MKVSNNQRDIRILNRIIEHCNEIDQTVDFFRGSLELLSENAIFKNAVSMCILQIGELTHHLTNEFTASHSGVPWRNITDMRNIAAHHYNKFSNLVLWETISDDISPLRDYCKACIDELQAEIDETETGQHSEQ